MPQRPVSLRNAVALACALALAVLASAVAAGPAAALPKGPPPYQGDCLGWQGPGLCVYNIGYIEFRLGKRVLHVGDTVSGSYTWGFSPTRSGSFLTAGEGLRLQRCSGDKAIGAGSSGARTCTWKATSPTSGWVTSLGIQLHQNASLGTYTENDFYVVVGRESVIEGEITREKTEGSPTSSKQGVPNVAVKIHGPQSKTVTTNANGYYVTTVKKSGRYRVTPKLPGRYGGSKAIEPESRVVTVSRSTSARADFKVDDDLQVTLSFDRPKVPANGLEVVTGTIRAERFGQPVPSLYVSVIPYKRVATNAETVAVPAHFCTNGQLSWPNGTRGVNTNAFPFDLVTDDRGMQRFTVQTGTVPGPVAVQVWAKDDAGRLRLKHVSQVSDTQTIANEPTGSLAPGGLMGELANVATAQGLTLSTSPSALGDELAAKLQRGLAYAPIGGSSMQGLLVYPATERPSFGGADGVVGANSGLVISPDKLNVVTSGLYGGFAGAVKAGQIPPLPSFATWAAGAGAQAQGWALTAQDGVVRLSDDLRGWRYLGFPYPQAGGC